MRAMQDVFHLAEKGRLENVNEIIFGGKRSQAFKRFRRYDFNADIAKIKKFRIFQAAIERIVVVSDYSL